MARINVEDHKKAIFTLNGIPPFEEEMKLKDAQVKNFTLLWMLIRKSDEKSPLFIKNTNSQKNVQERMLKLQLLGVSNKESL